MISFDDLKSVFESIMGVKKEIVELVGVVEDAETREYAEEFARSKGLTADNMLEALGEVDKSL